MSLSYAKAVTLAAFGVLLLMVSVPLWPGGASSYVVPRGSSMEPRVSGEDLAIVRTKSNYRVGDVVAYRNTALHRVVVHRIVAIDGDSYTLKGDANDFVDPQPVTRDQLVGRLSISLPLLGGLLLWLSSPVNALLLLALGALLYRDRERLLASVRRPSMATPARPAAGFHVDDARLIPIRDMSFPHELAVADVVRPESLLQLAERYDRPVLHDVETDVLFVVESSMLFRCQLAQVAVPATPLAVVRALTPDSPDASDALNEQPVEEPFEAPPVAVPAPDVLPRAATYAPRHERERRHNWPRRRDYGGRRKPSPHGRDWAYASNK